MILSLAVTPLTGTGRPNYSATSNNMKLVHWPLMGGGTAAPPRPLLAVPNVTAYPSTASVPITVLLYNGSLLCSFKIIRSTVRVEMTVVIFCCWLLLGASCPTRGRRFVYRIISTDILSWMLSISFKLYEILWIFAGDRHLIWFGEFRTKSNQLCVASNKL